MTTLALHIGAHKTATTHLQRSLYAQRSELEGIGVRVITPRQLRAPNPNLQKRFGLFDKQRHVDGNGVLTELAAGSDRVVISEENFVGALQDTKGRIANPIYKEALPRLAALTRATGLSQIEIFLSIRHPCDYLASAYSQLLLAGGRISAEDYRAINQVPQVDWLNLVQRISAVEGVGSITVWRYEDYQTLFPRIVEALLAKPFEVPPIAERIHQGLSTRAVETVLSDPASANDGDAANMSRERFPVSAADPGIALHSVWKRRLVSLRYARMCRQIARMPKVRFLHP